MTDLSRKNFLRFLAASIGSLYLSGCINQDKLLSRSSSPEKITPTPFLPDSQNIGEADPTPRTQKRRPRKNLQQPRVPVYPDLVVARQGDPEQMVRAAVPPPGGDGPFCNTRGRCGCKTQYMRFLP